jgi:lipooligosaccharide transport system ATP-binding protein
VVNGGSDDADGRDSPDGPDGPVVVARALTKVYDGGFTAVAGIDLTVTAGECFGMLGPNGAGKSSTMRMIGAVSPPTSGTLDVLGMDVQRDRRAVKARLGVVPQEDNLDDELTVRENLVVYAGFFGIAARAARSRADELLGFMGLGGRAGAKVSTLSGGMKRRLVIARALINDPDVVLLDEPTTGLDPQARHHIWERLRELRAGGTTLVLTTHYMEEAAQLCDRIVIMHRARIRTEGTPRELIARTVPASVVDLPREALAVLDGDTRALDGARWLTDRVLIPTDDAPATCARLAADGVDTDAAVLRPATLEDVFLAVTGHALDDADADTAEVPA